jgi:colicin import membrane protein
MIHERSYQIAFFSALLLHLAVLVFLLLKFVSYTAVMQLPAANIIKVITVNANEIQHPVATQAEIKPQIPVSAQPKPEPLKVKPQLTVKKHLPLNQKQELDSLQKEIRSEHKKISSQVQQRQAQQMQKQMQQQLQLERKELVASGASLASQKEIEKYKALILNAIATKWIIPDGVDKDEHCELLVNIGPGGVVLNVQLLTSSGNAVLDRSATTAVVKASPLPVPDDAALFDNFRVLKLIVRPEGIVNEQL